MFLILDTFIFWKVCLPETNLGLSTYFVKKAADLKAGAEEKGMLLRLFSATGGITGEVEVPHGDPPE